MTNSQEVILPRAFRHIISFNNREYHIFVSLPSQPTPPEGYPVFYILDANSIFGTFTEAVRAQSMMPDVEPSIVVGIGYDTDLPFHKNRHYDLTFFVSAEELPPLPDGKSWPEQGGASKFLEFIETKLKPFIENNYSINTRKQTLFGHSLGGLFVLNAFFTNPNSFQNYIAGSPSIAWNEKQIVEKEKIFCSKVHMNQETQLLLTMGELELGSNGFDQGRTEKLADRLQTLELEKLKVKYEVFAKESHISVLSVLVGRAIRFVMKSEEI